MTFYLVCMPSHEHKQTADKIGPCFNFLKAHRRQPVIKGKVRQMSYILLPSC